MVDELTPLERFTANERLFLYIPKLIRGSVPIGTNLPHSAESYRDDENARY